MSDDPITEDWLKASGFKWHQFDRQPGKHWLLWLGSGLKEGPSLTSYEDIGIELAANVPGQRGEWFCWLRGDAAGRYHRFIHLRHVTTQNEVMLLVVAISGRPWAPENHLYGLLHSPDNAARIREDGERLDRRLISESGPGAKWADIERDDTRGRALPEHMTAAIKGGLAS